MERLTMSSQIGSTSGPSRSPAPSHPQHHTVGRDKEPRTRHQYHFDFFEACASPTRDLARLTVFGWRSEPDRLALFLAEQAVVRTVPAPVLRIRVRVVRVAAEAVVASDVGQVATLGVDDIPHLLQARGRWTSSVEHKMMMTPAFTKGWAKRTRSYASLTREIMMMRPYPAFQ